MRVNIFRIFDANLAVVALWVLLVLGPGCVHYSKVDPLAGWNFCRHQDARFFDKAIQADVTNYIDKLPGRQRYYIGSVNFFELNGQHAVRVPVAVNGTDWCHILFYDKDNRRIKVIKYASNSYSS
jgi:hypothetical protein